MPAPTYFTGLDLHKHSVTATTVDAKGEVVASSRLPTRPEALQLYFADLPGSHKAGACPERSRRVEATAGWYWVSDLFRGQDIELRLAHAKGVRAITTAKVKTDSADARMLAQLLRTDLLPQAHMISDEMRPLRDVLRTRLKLVDRRVGALNSISRLLEKMNVEVVDELPEMMQLQAHCHIEQVELLERQIKNLEKALHPHLVPDEDVQRLLRIPGVGKAVAFTIRLEVDDITRFPSEGMFFSYCRLVPGARPFGYAQGRLRHSCSAQALKGG